MPIPCPAVFCVALAASCLSLAGCSGGGLEGETVNLHVADDVEVGPADAKAWAIAGAARAFLATLTDAQRRPVVYAFSDNEQRGRWSNFPTGVVRRGGIMRKDLNARRTQR